MTALTTIDTRPSARSTRRAGSRLVPALMLGGAFMLGMLGVTSQAQALPPTYCQTNGHGASGCNLGGNDNTGYCWKSSYSGTGYVCKEDEPPKPDDNAVIGLDPTEDVLDAELELQEELQELPE